MSHQVLDIIEDVKEKLTDQQYKQALDGLMELTKEKEHANLYEITFVEPFVSESHDIRSQDILFFKNRLQKAILRLHRVPDTWRETPRICLCDGLIFARNEDEVLKMEETVFNCHSGCMCRYRSPNKEVSVYPHSKLKRGRDPKKLISIIASIDKTLYVTKVRKL